VIIGSGPAALMLAAHLDERMYEVEVYEKNHSPARKFLVAGQGGFNLTHSDPPETLANRYSPTSLFAPLLSLFSNTDLIHWFKLIGIPTYIGSSKRVFPEKGIKPITVLNAILEVLKTKGVALHTNWEWTGWDDKGELVFKHNGLSKYIQASYVVFALGGASWKVTGSDGGWSKVFRKNNLVVQPFASSNSAAGIHWPASFVEQQEGIALKNISLSCGGQSYKGEAVITRFGLEGATVYALNPQMRNELSLAGKSTLFLDLKPVWTSKEIALRLSNARGTRSWSKHLADQLGLHALHIALLKALIPKEEYMQPKLLAERLKSIPLSVHSLAPIEEAISTTGGLALEELDSHFQLLKIPNHFAIGEMLDWDAPTGGYLLQGCFSMGYALAAYLNTQPELD
jgi:uncharacterized flavoprotein (TIGR03862 family)